MRLGSVTLVVKDTSLTDFGQSNLHANSHGPLASCLFIVSLDLSGCTNLKSLGTNSFNNASHLSTVILPPSLEKICDGALYGTAIKSLDLPPSVRYIGYDSLAGTLLTELVLPKGLRTLGAAALARTKIKTLVLYGAVVSRNVCNECVSLKSVVLPMYARAIGMDSFSGCTSLEEVIMPDPKFLVEIHREAFVGCTKLIELAAKNGFESRVTTTDTRDGSIHNAGDGVAPYLIDRSKRETMRKAVLVAYARFNVTVQSGEGSEEEKVRKAMATYGAPPEPLCCDLCGAEGVKLMTCTGCGKVKYCGKDCQREGWGMHKRDCKKFRKMKERGQLRNDVKAGEFFNCCNKGGGFKGVLGKIMQYV